MTSNDPQQPNRFTATTATTGATINQNDYNNNKQNISIVWRNLSYEINNNNNLNNYLKYLKYHYNNIKLINNNNKTTNNDHHLRRNDRKFILQNLSGHLYRQSLNGFLGPSGAGKTTLLNCLNGQLRKGLTSDTEIYLKTNFDTHHNDGNNESPPIIRMIQQNIEETILDKMTIKQILYYAFRFKNSPSLNHQSKQSKKSLIDEHIRKILSELLLNDHNILEMEFKKCSGGEQKRIAIAQELMSLAQPNFLFLDEPTTGLDSNSAYLVMKCLRNLAKQNDQLTILVSIHAPSSDILNLFDKIYILAKGGCCIYSNEPKLLSLTLEMTLQYERENEQRPAIEEYLKIACHGTDNEMVKNLATMTAENERNTLTNDEINKIENLKFLEHGIELNNKSFSIKDLRIQIRRMFQIQFNIEIRKFSIKIILITLLSIIIRSTFNQKMVTPNTCVPIDNNNDENYDQTCFDRLNDEDYNGQYKSFMGHYFLDYTLILVVMNILSFLQIFNVFRHEHRNQWYSLGTFYIAFSFVHFLEICFISSYIVILVYFLIDHSYVDDHTINWLRLANMIYFRSIFDHYLQSFTLLLALIFSNYFEVAMISGAFITQLLHVFSGSLYNLEKMNNKLVKFIANILNSKVPINGWLYSFYVFDRCDLDNETSYIMDDYSIDVDKVYTDVLKLVINIIVLRLLTFLILYLRFSIRFRKRKFVKSNNDRLNSITNDSHGQNDPKIIANGNKSIINANNNNNDATNIELRPIERDKNNQELNFEQFTRGKIMIAWRSLTLFANSSIYEMRSIANIAADTKLILRNLNGQFHFGTLNALMGPSGAGKTSLLRVLNGQMKTFLSVESRFYCTRYCPTRICYLTQNVADHLMPGLTTLQSLMYASKLKNIMDECNGFNIDHETIAKNLLNELNMADTIDTNVEKLSGGEQKRLALGLELTSLRMPNLICIDEPTSGLDSNSAEIVIDCLHRLAQKHNLTIIASVHQPNIEVLMLFDQLYVLAKGGVCVYNGPPTNIRQYLSTITLEQRKFNDSRDETTKLLIENSIFPVEKLIKYSCLSYDDDIVMELSKKSNETILKNDQLSKDTVYLIDGIETNVNRFEIRHFIYLFQRYVDYFKGHQFISIIIFTILLINQGLNYRSMFDRKIAEPSGCIDWNDDINQTCYDTDKNLELFDLKLNFVRNYTVIFTSSLLILLQSSFLLHKDLRIFINEHRNGWYSAGVFYLNRIIIEWIQLLIVLSLFIYIVDIYEPIRSGMYFWQLFFSFMSVISMQGAGYLLTILTQKNRFNTLAISILCFGIVNSLLSNGGTPIRQLHYFYQFLSNFSPLRFAIEATTLRFYGFGRCLSTKQTPLLLYKLRIDNDEYFYHCIIMITFNAVFYHTLALLTFLYTSNPFDRRRKRAENILNYHQKLKPIEVVIPGLSCHQEFHVKFIKT